MSIYVCERINDDGTRCTHLSKDTALWTEHQHQWWSMQHPDLDDWGNISEHLGLRCTCHDEIPGRPYLAFPCEQALPGCTCPVACNLHPICTCPLPCKIHDARHAGEPVAPELCLEVECYRRAARNGLCRFHATMAGHYT